MMPRGPNMTEVSQWCAVVRDAPIRQSPDGLLLYDENGRREIDLPQGLKSRAAELSELYAAVVHGVPLIHDGRWGAATLEVCLAILQSGCERREITMTRQVPYLPPGGN